MKNKPKFKRHHFLLSVEVPATVTRTDLGRYIREAIRGWQGAYPPDDPLFGAFSRKGSIGLNYPPKNGEQFLDTKVIKQLPLNPL